MGKDYLFEKLKQILFEEDRKERAQLKQHVEKIDSEINVREELEPRIEPILNDKIVYMQQNFPHLFGPEITRAIKKEIQESQDEVVEVLYPIVGKMIKKYIVKEMQVLSDKIDARIEKAFSWQGWLSRIKGGFAGVSQKDVIASTLIEPSLEEIFVISQDSGILLGSYSRNNAFDKDMVAGMLTAIKSFVKDAFAKEGQELETIEYETYKLLIRNFKSFYVVAAVSGIINTAFKNKLDDTILNFASRVLNIHELNEEDLDVLQVSGTLKDYFSKLKHGD